MVRSIWTKSLVTALACAGIASAQQPNSPYHPAPVAAPSQPEQIVTVQEPGKAAQRCKVLTSWKTATGATAYKVRAVDTGELITIVESGPASSVPSSQGGR